MSLVTVLKGESKQNVKNTTFLRFYFWWRCAISDAGIRAVSGVLLAAMHAGEIERNLICSNDCGGEAAWAGDIDILAPRDLLQLINHIKGSQVLSRPEAILANDNALNISDLAHVKGQERAKRALEIAAAGGIIC